VPEDAKRRKSVKFKDSGDVDDDGRTWQDQEIEALETRVADLLVENSTLKRHLDHKKYTEVYRENEQQKLELKNMYILQEENKDLRTELESHKKAGLTDAQKMLKDENEKVKFRNGRLLNELTVAEDKLKKMEEWKAEMELQVAKSKETMSPEEHQQALLAQIQGPSP
jgi:hypothetical protein